LPTSRLRDGLSTESEPLDPHPLAEQQETLAAIAFLERTVATVPLEGIILRYGSLYGPGASESLVAIVRKRQLPVIGSGSGVWSWLHVDDAAAATMAALDRGSPGVYNVVDDDPAPVSEWLPALASAVGARPPMRVPAWVGRIVAGRVPVRMMTAIRGASNQKARRELGWQPVWRSWREGFRDRLDELHAAA
jgi:nucleoside-diphosphate-sugar epimerase